jgi:ketopantoate hydroxymethyltransferase
VKQYAQLAEVVVGAARSYADEVRAGQYPPLPATGVTTPA